MFNFNSKATSLQVIPSF